MAQLTFKSCIAYLFQFGYFCILATVSTCENIEIKDDCDFHVTVIRQLENDGFHR